MDWQSDKVSILKGRQKKTSSSDEVRGNRVSLGNEIEKVR